LSAAESLYTIEAMTGRYVSLALGLAYLPVLWAFAPPDRPQAIIAVALIVPLLWLSVVDLQQREIPDGASLLIAVGGLLVWWREPPLLLINLGAAVCVASALAFAGHLAWRRRGAEMLGLGDAKLMGAGTLLVGAPSLWLMVLLASIGGITAALASRSGASEGVPFGPFLAYAIYITYLISV
jgi:prepilin signal peptidase PulO-like enzyme (type II secretory pathway)